MEDQSILEHASSPEATVPVPVKRVRRPEAASVSARIAAANARLTLSSEPSLRFPGEDSGRSLAEMAERDLDAALQLLVDRAQYITGASGAAIALRRGEHNDMLCRATAGANAPELGALLSMEYGLSGESVRTRQVLRCDDAERDPRVNREVCSELGIASVVVMPIVREKQVLGVFELLSGKPKAFDDRDLSALLRLSEMVETAVSHAVGAQIVPAAQPVIESKPQPDPVKVEKSQPELQEPLIAPAVVAAAPSASIVAPEISSPKPEESATSQPEPAATTAKKPLFWSAALRAQDSGRAKPNPEIADVPLSLRNLQKCQACGFPVSQGRTFCVECEEKQWRGHLPQPKTAPAATQNISPPASASHAAAETTATPVQNISSPATVTQSPEIASPAIAEKEPSISAPVITTVQMVENSIITPVDQAISEESSEISTAAGSEPLADTPAPDNSAPFLSSAMQSESWFAKNKYILGALLLVMGVIGAIAWLH
jgi:GAF domain